MSDSKWRHSSGRSGKPRPPSRGKEVKCPKCGQDVKVYGVELERHKVYKSKKKTGPWAWCTQKTVK